MNTSLINEACNTCKRRLIQPIFDWKGSSIFERNYVVLFSKNGTGLNLNGTKKQHCPYFTSVSDKHSCNVITGTSEQQL